jgi:hypothetical protein
VLGHALAFARRGLQVFPCKPRAKEPAIDGGCRAATTEPGTIERWWREEPNYNIALATGAASGVFVVDLDGADAENELKNLEAQHSALPASVEAITPRPGRHIFFLYPAGGVQVRNSTKKIAPDIDVRGDGGYVVAPPSIHPSGRAYCWSVDSARTFAAAPDWLLTLIAEPTNNGAAAMTPPSEWRELAKGVAEGARNCSAAKLAGHLLRRRVDPFVVLELLQGWNARCTPPLPERDIERIVDSIATRELQRRGAL